MQFFPNTNSISLDPWQQWARREADNTQQRAVNLDYLTLELRVHPPNIDVHADGPDTRITLDSANRPGTLIQVVECLTELGLSFKKARITSDGGWFVDEFVVHDRNAPVTDPKKLATIKQVLSVHFEKDGMQDRSGASNPDLPAGGCTVLELTGKDQHGLLSDCMNTLSAFQRSVCMASIWTARDRAAFVLCVERIDDDQWEKMYQMLYEMMGGAEYTPHILREDVDCLHQMRHERRLHRLMLNDELAQHEGARSTSGSFGNDNRCSENTLFDAHRHLEMPTDLNSPSVKVTYAPARRYWFVSIICVDRDKLLFDLVCALVDMDFDIYHATLDAEKGAGDVVTSTIEFYVRPQHGLDYDHNHGRRLAEMLKAAVLRRLPKGRKLKVIIPATATSSLKQLTNCLVASSLYITRATVQATRSASLSVEHTFYVADQDGRVPEASVVEEVCTRAGGWLESEATSDNMSTSHLLCNFIFSVLDASGEGASTAVPSVASDAQ